MTKVFTIRITREYDQEAKIFEAELNVLCVKYNQEYDTSYPQEEY